MRISAIQITGEGQWEPCDTDRALAGARDGSGTFWIRVDDYQIAELDAWLDELSLSAFARNRLLNQGEMTKVVPLAQGVVMDLRVLPAREEVGIKQISLLCLENLVISLDPSPGHQPAKEDSPGQGIEIVDPSVAGVLLSILIREAKRVVRNCRQIRADVLRLDERMDRDPGGVSLWEILALKDRLLNLLSVAEEQLECFNDLTASDSPGLDFPRLPGTVHLLLSAAGSAERMAERLEKRLADLRQRYDAHQQEKLNHRLAVLTVISAIFLPLTLVAGIWGMNFERMPELAYPWGYPAALALMLVIVCGMLWFFRRKGWFE